MGNIADFLKETSGFSLFGFLTSLFEAMIIFYFLQSFFQKNKISLLKTAGLIFSGAIVVSILTQVYHFPSSIVFIYFLASTYLFEASIKEKLIVVFHFFVIIVTSGVIVNGVNNFYSLITHMILQEEVKHQIFDVYLSDLTIFVCLFFIRNRKIKPLLLIGAIVPMILLYISNGFAVFVISATLGESNQDYLVITLNVVVLSLLLGVMFLFYNVEFRKKSYQMQLESNYLRYVHQIKEKEVIAIKENNLEIYKLKHDMKNQLFMIRYLYNKELSSGEEYIKKLLDNFDYAEGKKIFTGQTIIDYFLNRLSVSCQKFEVTLTIDAEKLPKMKLDDVDLTIIISNILDNAIEATKSIEDAHIDVQLKMKNNYFVFSCTNNYSSDYATKKKSSKLEKHGLGLDNVTHVIRKYNGEIKIEDSEEVFRISFFVKY